MTTAVATATGFMPAKPMREAKRGLVRTIRILRDNVIAAWGPDAFERDHMHYRMMLRHILLANNPEMIRHVMLDNVGNYVRDPLGQRILEPGLGQGLLTSEGAVWRRQRRLLAPLFQPRRIQGFAMLMIERAAAFADSLRSGQETDMADAMMRITLEIIAQSLFGADGATDVAAVGAAMDSYQATVKPNIPDLLGLPGWFPRPDAARGRAALSAMDRIITELVRRRRARIGAGGPAGEDMLGLMLTARDEEGGPVLSDAEIRDQMATFFLAGHETTATALTWVWYLLANDAAAEAKLLAELRAVLAGRLPQPADADKLIYTRMVIEEAMRLYPPAHTTSRVAVGDDVVGGVPIRKGTVVVISPWLMHRHKAYWAEPDRFDPENFSAGRQASRPRYTYLPFGAGPRICIGAGFAMTEAILILATIAQRFRFRLKPGTIVRPVAKITLRPQDGLPMRVEAVAQEAVESA